MLAVEENTILYQIKEQMADVVHTSGVLPKK